MMSTAVRVAYDTLAPSYDEMTKANDYEMWLGQVLLPELQHHDLRHGKALDVGCGTGRAFEPLLHRQWKVTGCDISPAMLDRARAKFGAAVPVVTADMRELPVFGAFDLVLALNDAVNYLTADGDLGEGLLRMGANLASTGLLLFDVNTLALFEEMYERECEPGGTFERMLISAGVEPHPHRQRHFPPEQLQEAIAGAGLVPLAMLGQREDDGKVVLSEEVDESRDEKIICIARLRDE